jgi:acetate kinase
MNILVINCGSSSLKFQLIDMSTEEVAAKGICERIGIEGSCLIYTAKDTRHEFLSPMADHKEAIRLVLRTLSDEQIGVVRALTDIDAVGHRVVHGGEAFQSSVLIDDSVLTGIEACNDLAPLHNPANLIGIKACQSLMPGTPMVAVFDTAFHQTMPSEAYLYGLPYTLYEKHKIRRYGFHGTSHAYISKRAAKLLGKPYEALKMIVCHLGNGASVCAIKDGKSVDTSMGLTPLEGLIMGTRSGDIDPTIIEFLMKKEDLTLPQVMDLLNKQSGVLGLSNGLSSDFRDIEAGYYKGDPNAIRAMETFCYHVAKYIGAYAAAMNGVDVICFTAGVGENGPLVRRLTCERLTYLGVHLDEEANQVRGDERILTTPETAVCVMAIPTNEELAIAQECLRIVS